MRSPSGSPRLRRLIAEPAIPARAPGAAGDAVSARGLAGSKRAEPAAAPAHANAEPAGSGAVWAVDEPAAECCDLCAELIPDHHRHLLDLTARQLRCACRACVVLFDRATAGGGHYRLVPDRRWYLADFTLDDDTWAGLRIPVEIAFFFHDTSAGRVVAFYPSPAGAVESLLELTSWQRLTLANPVLDEMAPDVEALLVNRSGGARDHWLVPIDNCYALVGLIRTHWKGLAGGVAAWDEIGTFFTGLRTAEPPPMSTMRGVPR
jgi:Family of unknown function (DUF5947)